MDGGLGDKSWGGEKMLNPSNVFLSAAILFSIFLSLELLLAAL